MSNLGRNKKRTVVTIVTLWHYRHLLYGGRDVLSCMTPESMTTQDIRGDVSISLDFESGNQMHPERELYKIQQNNPLSEELREQILDNRRSKRDRSADNGSGGNPGSAGRRKANGDLPERHRGWRA